MNVGTDKNYNNGEKCVWLKQMRANLAKKLIIMVKNVASKNKCGRLMKNMIPTNSYSGLMQRIMRIIYLSIWTVFICETVQANNIII